MVGSGDAVRLDAFLAARLDLSRSRIAALIADGYVTLNGLPARKRDIPSPGDRIEMRLPAAEPSQLIPEEIPLNIVYQDADLLVVNKPAGLVVHPAPGNRSGTLVHALLHAVGD
ncbi:MAG: S4 domain-containing protein, partial [Gemmatimonadota bacterium]|nr:S4 domain-containing protein [Gemmatimonadota bacterium]